MNLALVLTPLLAAVLAATHSPAGTSVGQYQWTNGELFAEVTPAEAPPEASPAEAPAANAGPAINEPEPPAPESPPTVNPDGAAPVVPSPDPPPNAIETSPPPQPPATPPDAVPPPVPVAPGPSPAPGAAPPAQSNLELSVKRRLYSELASNPKLQGAWVHVSIDPQRQEFVFHPIYDAARSEQQAAELQILLSDMLNESQYIVEPARTRPVTALVNELRHRIDHDLSLGGTRITGAYFRPTEGDGSLLELMLVGRVANLDQRDHIVRLGIALGEAPAFAETMRTVLVKPDEMVIVEPAIRAGAQLFDIGYNKFFRCKYAEALEAFNEAILESPGRIEFRYWRVLAEIALENMQSASDHLDPLMTLLRNPSSDAMASRQIVLDSLERAQGPIRWELIHLEREKLLGIR